MEKKGDNMNIKDKIKAAKDIRSQVVKVKEWAVKIEMRSMTGAQRANILNMDIEVDPKAPGKNKVMFEKLYPDIIIACSFDPETGDPIFGEEDRDWLMQKNCGPIEQLALVGMQLSGLSADALERAEKN